MQRESDNFKVTFTLDMAVIPHGVGEGKYSQ